MGRAGVRIEDTFTIHTTDDPPRFANAAPERKGLLGAGGGNRKGGGRASPRAHHVVAIERADIYLCGRWLRENSWEKTRKYGHDILVEISTSNQKSIGWLKNREKARRQGRILHLMHWNIRWQPWTQWVRHFARCGAIGALP